MALHVIIGTQWGDEGKGRIVDWYAREADITARANGGDNAGHTVTVGWQIYKLHLIPSGIIHPQVTAVLGGGMVINPASLVEEMGMLDNLGVDVTPHRLRITHTAHMITPAHRALDRAQEAARGKGSLGTTGRGIGPAYTDKAARKGLRMGDMLHVDFFDRLTAHLEAANTQLMALGAEELEIAPIKEDFHRFVRELRPYIADTSLELHRALKEGKHVIVEGAQGTLLDIDGGTYPFVTSSSTTAAGALTGLGLGLGAAQGARVTGVAKAFQTRVGTGPFPSEVFGQLAERLRGSGANPWDEYGTTTGRPRRVGWLDLVLLRYALRLNGVTELAVTKLDILTGLEKLRLCTGYWENGKKVSELEWGLSRLDKCQAEYEELPGWTEDVTAARKWSDLPKEAQAYLERIESVCEVPITLISVGAEREQLVVR